MQAMMWKAVATLAALVAGTATRQLMQTVWQRTARREPPTNPASPKTTWPEAIGWAAASGVAIAVGRLVAQRGVAGAWKAAAGSYPEGLETVGP